MSGGTIVRITVPQEFTPAPTRRSVFPVTADCNDCTTPAAWRSRWWQARHHHHLSAPGRTLGWIHRSGSRSPRYRRKWLQTQHRRRSRRCAAMRIAVSVVEGPIIAAGDRFRSARLQPFGTGPHHHAGRLDASQSDVPNFAGRRRSVICMTVLAERSRQRHAQCGGAANSGMEHASSSQVSFRCARAPVVQAKERVFVRARNGWHPAMLPEESQA